jgi:hypothetical protein
MLLTNLGNSLSNVSSSVKHQGREIDFDVYRLIKCNSCANFVFAKWQYLKTNNSILNTALNTFHEKLQSIRKCVGISKYLVFVDLYQQRVEALESYPLSDGPKMKIFTAGNMEIQFYLRVNRKCR